MIDRSALRSLLAQADRRLRAPLELVLVGGAAVLVLCEDGTATRDLDLLHGEALEALRAALADSPLEGVDLNTRSAMFESLLPEGWEQRVRWSDAFSTRNLRVGTPPPEDLAVMKVFRYRAKDAEDIARLASLPGFDFRAFRRGFEAVLPIATGDPRYHAQSFCLAWNTLRPGQPLSVEALLAPAGPGAT